MHAYVHARICECSHVRAIAHSFPLRHAQASAHVHVPAYSRWASGVCECGYNLKKEAGRRPVCRPTQ
eukprot:5243883-Pleurochrysis_carterae.AAC.1